MEESPFKINATVCLKSGGPDMIIEKFNWDDANKQYRTDKVDCIWFIGKKLQRGTFDINALKIK